MAIQHSDISEKAFASFPSFWAEEYLEETHNCATEPISLERCMRTEVRIEDIERLPAEARVLVAECVLRSL